ncbi:MAG: TolC family protein, partial [Deltaproteobacteria bacterium]|nr:TolC family protein [Deltaproteobacteria bacterium]
PETRAAFERWRASALRISRTRRLPEPTLSFGYFVRSVETRVGPQRFKVGIAQTFPWPTKLSAASDAASQRANAAQRVVDAELLRVKRDVAAVYWTLWLIEEEHRLKTEHDAVLESLAGAVRGRLRTGAATLADLNQIELNIARHHDHRGKHKEARRKASAMLMAALGVAGEGQELRATDKPHAGFPEPATAALRDRARSHPRITKHDHLALGEESRARAERADRFPRIRVGVDFIETGDAAMPGVPDSGKDPLIVSAGISVPLWAGSYSDSEKSARAAARAHRADQEAAVRRAEGAFDAVLSDVRDAQRRIELYEKTLVPQAESTFQAVLGGYQTGRSTVAAVILAQRDLLELQIEHARARAEHARAWTALEYIVGTELNAAGGP